MLSSSSIFFGDGEWGVGSGQIAPHIIGRGESGKTKHGIPTIAPAHPLSNYRSIHSPGGL